MAAALTAWQKMAQPEVKWLGVSSTEVIRSGKLVGSYLVSFKCDTRLISVRKLTRARSLKSCLVRSKCLLLYQTTLFFPRRFIKSIIAIFLQSRFLDIFQHFGLAL